jgi:hypothetical protein
MDAESNGVGGLGLLHQGETLSIIIEPGFNISKIRRTP